MKRIIRLLPAAAVLFMGMLSCDEKESIKEEKQSGPKIETLSADKGTFKVATLSGRVSGLDGVALDFECGIEYSTDESFSDEYSTRQKVDKKYNEDSYSITVSGIQPGKKYYYRAYYINQLLIYYGDVKTITFEWSIDVNGYEYVDLGLSVLWATHNLGAEKPEDYGDYYAWGDTTTKYQPGYAQSESPQWKLGMLDGYSWKNYRFCNKTNNSLFKYCSKSDYGLDGMTDTLTILTPADDVAHYRWGGNWRMPTQAEFKELLDSCVCEFITQNGVDGLKVISRKDSSKSIFLPAAGNRDGTGLNYVGSYGSYWSSSLYAGLPYYAWNFFFSSGDRYSGVGNRYNGRSVRPVCP